MANPAQRRSFSPSLDYSKTEAFKPFKRRDYVIQKIGMDNLEAFELWAFPKNPREMIYNNEIQFHWANAHSTKGVPQDPDRAIEIIVGFWLSRFSIEETDD